MSRHKSVLLGEVARYLSPKSPNIYVDATVGAGGHAEKILELSGPEGRLIGIDVDPYMLNIAQKRLKKFGKRCIFVEDNYTSLSRILSELKIDSIDGIIFDLGVAREHFELPERGFSIKREGSLDMRLSPKEKVSALHIINEWEAEELIGIFYKYGEERKSKKIVKEIINERKKKRIVTTTQLADIVKKAVSVSRFYPYRKSKVAGYKIHPATRVFQALRIAVNNELKNIEDALPVSVDLLGTGGRICVISFHSLEDRLVKNIFRSLAKGCICPPEVPKCICGNKPKVKIITKKPIVSEKKEIAENPRARSAKLRVAEKI